MVKKLKAMAEKKAAAASGLFDSALSGTVKESAQQIWLAGLGAFSKAQEEGGKVFEALVREGTALQKKTQAVAEEKIGEMTSRMSSMAGDVSAKAGQQWDKLESIFEERTSKALKKLGVPASAEIQALVARIDALEAQVAKLGKPAKAATARTSRASSAESNGAVKPATRRSTARKSA